MSTRIQRIMEQYQCNHEHAQRFIDLRNEGYSITQAGLMAGISDPPDPDRTGVPTSAQHQHDKTKIY